nr:DUF2905 family protein [Thalassobacillus sp. C254]
MADFPKIIIGIGIALIIFGLIWQVGGKFISLGKLPGDILFKKRKYNDLFSDCYFNHYQCGIVDYPFYYWTI